MIDETETIRRQMVAEINANPGAERNLKPSTARSGTRAKCRTISRCSAFSLRLSSCSRRSDGVRGSLMFQNDPRLYYGFSPE